MVMRVACCTSGYCHLQGFGPSSGWMFAPIPDRGEQVVEIGVVELAAVDGHRGAERNLAVLRVVGPLPDGEPELLT